jgi:undecaprenyl pyrophosphate phosphatase UppP
MFILKDIIFGVDEGITEFSPISSTRLFLIVCVLFRRRL